MTDQRKEKYETASRVTVLLNRFADGLNEDLALNGDLGAAGLCVLAAGNLLDIKERLGDDVQTWRCVKLFLMERLLTDLEDG